MDSSKCKGNKGNYFWRWQPINYFCHHHNTVMCDPGLLGRHFQEVDELLQLSRGREEERQRGGESVQLYHN